MKTSKKNKVLKNLARLLQENKKEIINKNKKDIENCENISESLLDRLKINEDKIDGMIESVEKTITFEDPEGKILYEYVHDNKMVVKNTSVAFGNILIIYESRPDVTIEASILAFKAGNKVLLKGGSEARYSNKILVDLWKESLESVGLDTGIVKYLDLSRKEFQEMIKQNMENVDLIIPRGGAGLINFVKKNTDLPMLVSGRGNNFLFVDRFANFDMATKIILNGKSRISVCNALDKVLLDEKMDDLESKLKTLIEELIKNKIEVIGSQKVCDMDRRVKFVMEDEILGEEFLSAKIYLSLASDVKNAAEIINKYSGGHSATIISSDMNNAKMFQDIVDCAAVYHNVSTRFTDGGQWGFGAEIAISTQKLHFRGPIGLNQLVTNKWYISGNGQIRS